MKLACMRVKKEMLQRQDSRVSRMVYKHMLTGVLRRGKEENLRGGGERGASRISGRLRDG